MTVFCSINTFSQIKRDQDLITLKNGYQLLGFIVEQQPGTAVKIFRPTQNDTITVKMEEIDKLSKIFVDTFSAQKMSKKDTSLIIGRFNNKKNVFQLSYLMVNGGQYYYGDALKGIGIAYYRSIKNHYLVGLSTSIASFSNFDDYSYSNYTIRSTCIQLLVENKIRLSRRPQNKRFTALLGVNAGYVFDNSYVHTGIVSGDETYVQKIEYTGNYTLQANISFKVNPDNNSGFIIEPGIAMYQPRLKLYNSDGAYLGYKQVANSGLLSLRLSYFF